MAASGGGVSLQAFRQIWKMMASGRHFDRVFDKVSIVSASPGRCRCEMTVEEEHTNGQGTLHGGFVSSLVDTVTQLAVLSSDAGKLGVSVQLNISFLRSAAMGEKVSMDAEVVKAGKSLAFTKADLFNAKGDVVAQGKHIIFVGERKNTKGLS